MVHSIDITLNKSTDPSVKPETFSQTTILWEKRRYTLYLKVGDKDKAKLTNEQWERFKTECLTPLLEQEKPHAEAPTVRVSLTKHAASSAGGAGAKPSEWIDTCHKAEKVALTASIAKPSKRTPRATKLHGIHRNEFFGLGNTCYVASFIQMIVSDSTLRKELAQDPVVYEVLQAYDQGSVPTELLAKLITHCGLQPGHQDDPTIVLRALLQTSQPLEKDSTLYYEKHTERTCFYQNTPLGPAHNPNTKNDTGLCILSVIFSKQPHQPLQTLLNETFTSTVDVQNGLTFDNLTNQEQEKLTVYFANSNEALPSHVAGESREVFDAPPRSFFIETIPRGATPTQIEKLTLPTKNGRSATYSLRSMAVYQGDEQHGHYTARVKQGNKYTSCDDSRVTSIDEKAFTTFSKYEAPRLLYYCLDEDPAQLP